MQFACGLGSVSNSRRRDHPNCSLQLYLTMAVPRTSQEKADVETLAAEAVDVVDKAKGLPTFGALGQEELDFLANFSEQARKKVVRKVDVR